MESIFIFPSVHARPLCRYGGIGEDLRKFGAQRGCSQVGEHGVCATEGVGQGGEGRAVWETGFVQSCINEY